MRSRSKVFSPVSLSGSHYYTYCTGVTSNPFGPASITGPSGQETMLDNPCFQRAICGNSHRAVMHPVNHNSSKYSLGGGPWRIPNPTVCTAPNGAIKEYITPPVGTYLARTRWWVASDPSIVFRTATLGLPSSQDAAVGHYDRWIKAKPGMATRANLTVFLVELRDIRKLWEIIPWKHFRLETWADLLRYGNSQHLNWNFGWKPFISDLKAVMRGLASFESRLGTFLKGQNTQLVRHQADPPSETQVTSSWFACNGETSMWYQAVGTRTEQFRSTFQFSYIVPEMDYQSLRWRAYLDTLGLAATWSNVWELLPFSFVADWFTGIGDRIRATETDWIEPWIYFCQACSSYKCTQRVQFDLWYQGWNKPKYNNFASWDYKSYQRGIGLPRDAANVPELNSDKIRLLASLGLAQLL